MKKSLISIALFAAGAIPLAASAQISPLPATPWYVTGNVGQSRFDLDGLSGDNKDNAYNIGVGYNFSRAVAVELGYTDFGVANFSGFEGKAQSSYAALILSAPMTNEFSVFGRLGAASTDRRVGGLGFNASERKTEGYYGVGLAYAFTRNLAGTVEYQRLSDSDVSAGMLGVRLGF
jgi:OOP family OmpA-OmpF porin